jgi:hypothetical protein
VPVPGENRVLRVGTLRRELLDRILIVNTRTCVGC